MTAEHNPALRLPTTVLISKDQVLNLFGQSHYTVYFSGNFKLFGQSNSHATVLIIIKNLFSRLPSSEIIVSPAAHLL